MALHPDASKQSRWLQLIRLWQQSHLTVRAFCHRHRLSEPSFYSWRRVLTQRGLLADADDPPAAPASAPPAAFVQVALDAPAPPRPSTAPSPVELVLRTGRRLRLRPGFDPATLQQLLRLLEEQP